MKILCVQLLPITVKLIFKFRVGELRKSTRQRYIPSSESLILSTFNCAGEFVVLKKARWPNAVGDDVDFACVNGLPRTSKLFFFVRMQRKRKKTRWNENKESMISILRTNIYFELTGLTTEIVTKKHPQQKMKQNKIDDQIYSGFRKLFISLVWQRLQSQQ